MGRIEAGNVFKDQAMRLNHEGSCQGVKVSVLYHEGNGNSLKGMENALGMGQDGGRKSRCTNSGGWGR